MKEFKITEQQAQAILNYLSTCPYGQVYQLVAILMNLEEIKEQKNGNSK
jgi:hypothetical protein